LSRESPVSDFAVPPSLMARVDEVIE